MFWSKLQVHEITNTSIAAKNLDTIFQSKVERVRESERERERNKELRLKLSQNEIRSFKINWHTYRLTSKSI